MEARLSTAEQEIEKWRAALSTCFSQAQIKALKTGKPVTRWKESDIISALALCSLSMKTYTYLRDKDVPLPSVSTLRRWISDVNVEPGILNSVIRMMHIRGASLSIEEKICIISFDERKIEKKYSYDKAADKMYTPKNYVQVLMARGIIGGWKQPVFYDFDCKMTKDLLIQIITEVEKAGFPVHACCSM